MLEYFLLGAAPPIHCLTTWPKSEGISFSIESSSLAASWRSVWVSREASTERISPPCRSRAPVRRSRGLLPIPSHTQDMAETDYERKDKQWQTSDEDHGGCSCLEARGNSSAASNANQQPKDGRIWSAAFQSTNHISFQSVQIWYVWAATKSVQRSLSISSPFLGKRPFGREGLGNLITSCDLGQLPTSWFNLAAARAEGAG